MLGLPHIRQREERKAYVRTTTHKAERGEEGVC